MTLTADGFSKRFCDNTDGTSDGMIAAAGLPATTYALTQTTTPSGYIAPAATTVILSETESNLITLVSGRTDLTVTLVDQNGNPVTGACWIFAQGSYAKTMCDNTAASGGLNGVTRFERVAATTPVLTETTVPLGSAAILEQMLTLTPGIANSATVTTTTLALVDLTVTGIDQDDRAVKGICVTLARNQFQQAGV